MANLDVFSDNIKSIQPYKVQSSSGLIKLDAMEMPYRLPEEMREALGTILSMGNLHRYPNSKSSSLIAKIKSTFQLPEQLDIMMGNGSDELIQMILMATAKSGAKVMSPVPSFVMYKQTAEILGMTFVGVDLESDLSLDEAKFLSAIEEHQPAVIFLAYPNNPTGLLLDKGFVEKVLEKSSGLVVLDEAYTAYASDNTVDLLERFDNAVLIRTLSKIGLAGIRLGYLVANPVICEQLEKVRMPYNINRLTQATARFMLDQMSYFNDCVRKVLAEKEQLFNWLSEQPGMTVLPSETNFLLLKVADADRVFQALRDEHKILVKNLHNTHPVLENTLRITIGTEMENRKLRQALSQIVQV